MALQSDVCPGFYLEVATFIVYVKVLGHGSFDFPQAGVVPFDAV